MSESVTKADLLGGRVPFKEIAAALEYKDEQPVRKLVRELNIPYIIVDRRPHVLPQDVREALERRMVNGPQRGPGRPRKA